MSSRQEQGFTIVEVMLAVVLLAIGVMALVGSSAMVTRMIGRGRESTTVGQIATARAERLRQIAAATSPACGSANLVNGTSNPGSGITERWELKGAAGDRTRDVLLMYTYRAARTIRTDTMSLTLLCD
jgi:prepilin-type N-terminal cleavage/methylation domain-containing protein